MCTVTFIPVRDTYYITSNRDEKNSRSRATPPAFYKINNSVLLFPKDGDAGGSWIALNENGNAAVLLNGAFENHAPAATYKMSRGKIFLNVIADPRAARYFDRLDLTGIQPFTIVLFDEGSLYDCRWDGKEKHCRQLRNYRPYIWSSATLYEKEAMKKREQWFAEFLNRTPNPTREDILRFHQSRNDEDKGNSILMSRDNAYHTVSITGIFLTADRGSMRHIDLADGKNYERKIVLTSESEIA